MTMNVKKVEDNIEAVSTLLKAVSNNRRMVIVCALAKGEKSVGQLEKIVVLSQSALSQHLARLRRDGVVKTRRSAQTIYYSIKCTKAEQLLKSLNRIYGD
ncbi:MAG: transcriptional regulator [Micavibrio sp.]|nr:MAG: transcriptional regulator [Micavibrio sp.]